ncbi:YeeE/YedE family protein [Oceanibium sediminis]|uniref:YeeE/YedE family protein n=1 Tax=Oceanibium sediminis TaxID=2026339 RepID=UPI000DD4D9F2|nr:YeeE/YedE thiosulfate transporter family protein [Oceanibium sediminis]
METTFTPLMSLAGGALIGLSAVVLMATVGRIAGISGIIAGVLSPTRDGGFSLRLAFLIGLLAAMPLALLVAPQPEIALTDTPILLILGGLLVGYGAVRGGGCTSGHGVCGLSRLSTRSLVATATFMVVAALTVFVMRHVLGVS